jgi:hypothetical protein
MKRRTIFVLIIAATLIIPGSLLIKLDTVHGLVTAVEVTETENQHVALGETDYAISHKLTGSGFNKPSNYTEYCKFNSESYVLLTDHSYYSSTYYTPMIPPPNTLIDHSFDLSALTPGTHVYYYKAVDGDDSAEYTATWTFIIDPDTSSVYVNYTTDQTSDTYIRTAPKFTIGGYDVDSIEHAWVQYNGNNFSRPDETEILVAAKEVGVYEHEYTPDNQHKVTGLAVKQWNTITQTLEFSKYKTVSIDLSIGGAGSTIDDYAAYVKVDYDSDMNNDFSDIRFTDTSNNDLYFELESKIDGVEAHYWVRIDNFDDYEHEIRLHYGCSEATDGSDAANTWTDGWVAVHHFNEESGTLYDSSGQGNNLSSSTGSPAYGATGVGNCIDLDGSSYFYDDTTWSGLHDLNNHFIFALIKPDTVHATTGWIFDQEDFNFGYENSGADYGKGSVDGSPWSFSSAGIDTGTWRSLMMHATGTHLRWHLDGLQTDAKSESGCTDSNTGDATIGSGIYGLIDEFRIFNAYKGRNYALAIHRNTIQFSTYVTFGSEQSSNYEQVTIHGSDNSITQITPQIEEDLLRLDFGDKVTVNFTCAAPGTVTFGMQLNFALASNCYFIKENYIHNDFITTYEMPDDHFDNISEGWFWFNITLHDFTGGVGGAGVNYTRSLYLKKVTTGAMVEILTPLNNTVYKLGVPVALVWTITTQTENYTAACYLNSSLQAYTTGSSVILSEGAWIFAVDVTDQAGNYNYSSVTFYIKEYFESRITYKTLYDSKIDFDVFNTYITLDGTRTAELNGYFDMRADQKVTIETYSDFGLLLHNKSYSYNETIFINLNVHFIQIFNNNNASVTMDVSLVWQTATTNESLSFSLPDGAISEQILIYRDLTYIITWGAKNHLTTTEQLQGYQISRGTVSLKLTPKKEIEIGSLSPAALLSYFTVGFLAVKFVLAMRPEKVKEASKGREEKIKGKAWFAIRWILFALAILGLGALLVYLFDFGAIAGLVIAFALIMAISLGVEARRKKKKPIAREVL